jgi:hypothetical protein
VRYGAAAPTSCRGCLVLREERPGRHPRVAVAGKVRRDRVKAFEARAKAIGSGASELDFDRVPASINNLSLEECDQEVRYVEAFIANRRAVPPVDRA